MDSVISSLISLGIVGLVAFLIEKSKKHETKTPALPHIKPWEDELPAVNIFQEEIESMQQESSVVLPPLPEEGMRVSIDLPEEDTVMAETERRQKAKTHRQRWRRAMTDSFILSPKF